MGIDARTIGSGEHKVIVVHDWFGTADAWRPFLDYLDTDAFTFAFPDARGYGSRRDVPGEHTVEEFAGDVLAAADELGWQTFSLVGHSMGGKVVQRVLADAPDRVRKLVGVAGVPAAAFPVSEERWAGFLAAEKVPAARRGLIDFLTGGKAGAVWLDRFTQQSFDSSDPAAFGGYVRSWVPSEFVAEVLGKEQPVKIIVGENDPGISADVARATWLKFYPNAELDVLPGAGHFPMHETPVALAASLESFLR